MNLKWVRQLVRLVEESEIDSLEVSRLWTRVSIRKSPEVRGGFAPVAPAAGSSPGSPGPAGDGGSGGEATETEEETHAITSPMVGTFYRAPAPDAPPYVQVGDRVEKGQTLCILEAMKLMNELESEVSGTIREICVENAEPVEYDQLLFRVELDGTG